MTAPTGARRAAASCSTPPTSSTPAPAGRASRRPLPAAACTPRPTTASSCAARRCCAAAARPTSGTCSTTAPAPPASASASTRRRSTSSAAELPGGARAGRGRHGRHTVGKFRLTAGWTADYPVVRAAAWARADGLRHLVGVVQSVEHQTVDLEVVGSSPITHPPSGGNDGVRRRRGQHGYPRQRRLPYVTRSAPCSIRTVQHRHRAAVAPVAQMDRAPDFESVGRRFESCRARSEESCGPPAPGAGAQEETASAVTSRAVSSDGRAADS